MQTHIGCSGFYYGGWKGIFYPKELPKNKWLPYYANHFDTVEINNSFYKIPKEATFQKWYDATPPDFKFALKGNRYMTHIKKLKIDEQFRERLFLFQNLALGLKEKLGCILWQFPGSIVKNLIKLEKFCSSLNKDIPHVIEFRHISWFEEPVFETLSAHRIGFCMISAPDNLPETVKVTSQIAYVRFHGKYAWYNYNYSHEELEEWKYKLANLKADQLYIYFNNDYSGYAIQNSKALKKILET